MHLQPPLRRAVALLTGAFVATAMIVPPAAAADDEGDDVRVIIEFDGPSAGELIGPEDMATARASEPGARSAFASDYEDAVTAVADAQEAVLARLDGAGITLAESTSVTGLLDALVTTVDVADLEGLRATPGVARVTEEAPVQLLGETSIPSTNAPRVWERTDGAGLPVKGSGATVAVIDTGIDYTLPDLGGGFGPGHRVVDGYDFVNDDADPMDDHSHGTHVAGIVGAGGSHLTGMAPEVTLTAWKALDARGGGTTAGLLLALEAATDPLGDHPADVVNMSLGTAGDGTDPIGRASTAAAQQGVVVVAAAGNSGPGDQSVSSPAAAEGVLAVGAGITGVIDPTLSLVRPKGKDAPKDVQGEAASKHVPLDVERFPLSANPPQRDLTARLVDVGQGLSDEDYAQAGDVRGAIVVMESRNASSLEQVQDWHLVQAELAEKHGAVGALLYEPSPTDPRSDPVDGPMPGPVRILRADGYDLRRASLVMMSISSAQYQTVKEQVLAGRATGKVGSTDRTDEIASFSSRGPSDATTLKPEIVAPGFEIMSSIPASFGVEGDQYRMSGTSMAAPHVAGAAALLVQAHPRQSGPRLRSALIGSARELGSRDRDASPSVQGAGTLDVAAAVGQKVTASPDAVSLGLADMGSDPARTRTIVLHNAGSQAVRVKLAVEASAHSAGEVSLSARSVRIPAGRDASVELTVTPTVGAVDAETSGVVVGTVSDGSTVRVPYASYVRPLQVQTSPTIATGETSVFVHAPMAPESTPTVHATAPSGERYTTALTAIGANPGWYRGELPLDEAGVHTIDARATIAGRTVTGTGSVQAEGAEQPGAWEHVGLSGTGRELATSPTAPGTGLAVASIGAHPFVTKDYGVTWDRVRSVPVADGVAIPAADTQVPGGFFLALNGSAGAIVLDPSYQGRLVHTPDAGATWTVLPFPDVAIQDLVADGDALAALSSDGLRLSQDGGQDWRHVASSWTGQPAGVAFAGDAFLIATDDGVYRIADARSGGREVVQTYAPELWNEYPAGLVADGSSAMMVRGDGIVLASTDGGLTWAESGDVGQGHTTAMEIADGTVYIAGLSSYSTSDDNGSTWRTHDLPVLGPLPVDVDHWPGRPSGEIVMAMEQAGFYATTDGDEWTKIGVSGTDVHGVDVGVDAEGEPLLRVVDAEGLHERSLAEIDPGDHDWGSIGAEGIIGRGLTEVAQSPLGDRDVWAAGSTAQGQARLVVGGADEGDAGLREIGPTGGWAPTALALSPHAERTVAVGYTSQVDTGLMVSTDGFTTWTSYAHEVRIQDIAVDPVRKDRLWLATSSGLYRSDDLGRTITRLTEDYALSVRVGPEGRHVVVGEQPGARVSTDGGKSFTEGEGLEAAAVTSIEAATVPDGPAAGTELLVAGAGGWRPHGLAANGAGVFVSLDEGATWAPASAGLSAMSVRSLAADGRWLYAGTDQGGVHRTPIAALVAAGSLVETSTHVTVPKTVKRGERPEVRVTVKASDAEPSGSVTITVVHEKDHRPQTRTVDLRDGQAEVRLRPVTRTGEHVVTATYEPDGGFASSEATARFVAEPRR
ncbi:hypothetical protein GCM10009718_14390 [Isoptericola halotolerans]|uniref:Subtilisin family serine protease n=1 Tax=Isoptericola halotolerans TaxID=300560 RepID=A0ABX1ZYN4_9MICO|nr:S8 family serine peptidase [Isoptericola halotolerans]NOV95640.1 subtilisin family serine protease [Isoptericola halotolerans]